METKNKEFDSSVEWWKYVKNNAFTLVELIVVITILAILATIAFVNFQGYASQSRDSNRVSSMKNAETWLEIFQTKSGVYPTQLVWAQISVSWSVVTIQWDFSQNITRVINMNEVPKDPLSWALYKYISDTKGKWYKILYYLENSPDYAMVAKTYASDEVKIPMVKGTWPWVVLDSQKDMVLSNIDLFWAESWSTFTMMVSGNVQVSWSGFNLGGWFQNLAERWWRLDAPKTCPTGFIAVPWNAEFLQPWFCVAKYEMSYEDVTTPNSVSWFNTVDYSISWTLVSKPWLFPIANISQNNAKKECGRIGGHLITNNEWMTIARNIEAVWNNWSSGQVGSGSLYRGINGDINASTSLGCGTLDSIGNHTRASVSTALFIDTNKWWVNKWNNCDSKRQFKLNNGEIIWDLAGNVWEHVDRWNYLYSLSAIAWWWDVCWGTTWNWIVSPFWSSCVSKYWPKNNQWPWDMWMWSYFTSGQGATWKVFLRWGYSEDMNNSWVYSLSLHIGDWDLFGFIGFRCAY